METKRLIKILENNTLKPLWVFEIRTDHLSWVRRKDLVIVNKKREAAK